MSDPRVAVLSLTRDRLAYSQVAFKALRQNAGIPFDHFVLDQGSTDGTQDWLVSEFGRGDLRLIDLHDGNVGIHKGMNVLLDWIGELREPYDLLVKVDNDCRVLTPGTLKAVAEYVLEDPRTPRVVSPLILGLRNRPGLYQVRESVGSIMDTVTGYPPYGRLGMTRALGGIFMPLPPSFVKAGFRYDESAPLWGGDDERIVAMAHAQGGYSAYLLDYEAEHIDTTEGQVAKYPEYFARRVSEGGPPK